MKYLIQNRKEFAISVGFFIMTAINLGKSIYAKEINQDLIVAVIYAFFGVLAWFYNMPTSEANSIYTGMMRLEKQQKSGKITGENFFDEIEDGGEMEEENDEEFEQEGEE